MRSPQDVVVVICGGGIGGVVWVVHRFKKNYDWWNRIRLVAPCVGLWWWDSLDSGVFQCVGDVVKSVGLVVLKPAGFVVGDQCAEFPGPLGA